MQSLAEVRAMGLPTCINTRIPHPQTSEAHFTQVASIWDEPEAVGLRVPFIRRGSNRDLVPIFSVPRSEDVNKLKLPGMDSTKGRIP